MRLGLLFSLLFLISCTNLSKNIIKEGEFTLKRGVYKTSQWDESLEFKRISWFHELTLQFDLLITKLDDDTRFRKWLSPSEKALLADCRDHYLVLSYHLDSDKISKRMLFSDMERQGYKEYLLPNFQRNIKLHPDFELLSLQLYSLNLLCSKEEKSKDLSVTFPGYKSVNLLK
ncbi:hypothetical protein HBN50_12500 [Halobacteriovorax sp. GB3]|uniref:hypothetical protein n=1 Tax=Halobacteriovorax sp. GB3 TaxID=2719615 RepID=UPI00235FB818|nr:hypothetical protein [Halobacteriovorax sp. GB3]MDD0853924.1 hypothetical protein [Halobacteriovorax sp. GB3]